MKKIIIREQDEAARAALQALLDKTELAAQCVFAEGASAQAAEIWIGGADETPPPHLESRSHDCFYKPARAGKILERIQRHIHENAQKNNNYLYSFGKYQINSADNDMKNVKTGDITRLTDKEKHILLLLLGNEGEIVAKQTLLDEVWGYAQNVETHTLETHIYRLRQKIEDDPSAPQLLLTQEPGYCLRV